MFVEDASSRPPSRLPFPSLPSHLSVFRPPLLPFSFPRGTLLRSVHLVREWKRMEPAGMVTVTLMCNVGQLDCRASPSPIFTLAAVLRITDREWAPIYIYIYELNGESGMECHRCSYGTFETELASRRSLDTSRISIPYRRVIQPSLCLSASLSMCVCASALTSVGVRRHANR